MLLVSLWHLENVEDTSGNINISYNRNKSITSMCTEEQGPETREEIQSVESTEQTKKKRLKKKTTQARCSNASWNTIHYLPRRLKHTVYYNLCLRIVMQTKQQRSGSQNRDGTSFQPIKVFKKKKGKKEK